MYKPKHKATCDICHTSVYSHYSGEYRTCPCGRTYIDENEFIFRHGKNCIISEIDESEFIWTTMKGEQIMVKDLTNDHAKNIIKMLGDLLEDFDVAESYIYNTIKKYHGL